ncbi:MAG: SWIM zinc finger family protein [Rickettsiales bacterium]|nr:SWIM zinc finger family protein [Rickettsiales bacterium]
MTKTFWGQSWCEHFEKMADYENRLPRGRTYARNGSIVHLELKPGKIYALVAGSDVYEVNIDIQPLNPKLWEDIKNKCSGKIKTMLALLNGQFSQEVMSVVCDPEQGLFPLQSEISYHCTCPDFAGLCKHVAAVFYGIGNRLDTNPELIFTLRQVDPMELFSVAAVEIPVEKKYTIIPEEMIEEVFGVVLVKDFDPEEDYLYKALSTGKITEKPHLSSSKILKTEEPIIRKSIPGRPKKEDSSTLMIPLPSKVEQKSINAKPILQLAHPDNPDINVPDFFNSKFIAERKLLSSKSVDRNVLEEDIENSEALAEKIVQASIKEYSQNISSNEPCEPKENKPLIASAVIKKIKGFTISDINDSFEEKGDNYLLSKKDGTSEKAKIIWLGKTLNFSRITGKEMQRMRLLAQLSEKEIATMLDVCVSTYKKWENTKGVLNLKESYLKKVTEYYNNSFVLPS